MPTVLDAFVVTFGLDATKFIDGQKQVDSSMKKTKDAAVKHGKDLEESNKKFAASFDLVKRQAIEFFGIIIGANGIKSFIADVTNATAALGRLSSNLNVSPQELGAWGAAIERVGGSASEAAGDFQALSAQLYDLRQNGKNIPPELQKLAAESRVPIDINNGVPGYLRSIGKAASELTRLHGGDRSDSFNFLTHAGIGPGMAQVLIDNGAQLDKFIGSLKDVAPTEAQTKKFESLQTSFTTLQQKASAFGRTMVAEVAPSLDTATDSLSKWIDKNKGEWENDAVEGVKQFNDAWKEVHDLLVDVGNKLDWINDLAAKAGKSAHDSIFGPSKPQGDPTGLTGMSPLEGMNYLANGAGADFRNWILKQIAPSGAHAGTLDDLKPGRGNSGPHPAPGLSVDGKSVSRGNPMPVTLVQSETGSGGGGFLSWLFGSSSPTSPQAPSGGDSTSPSVSGGDSSKSWVGGAIHSMSRALFGKGGEGVRARATERDLGGTGVAPAGAEGAAVTDAKQMVGLSEVADREKLKQYLRTGGVGMDPRSLAWCAGFVNAALGHQGIKGTGSLMAGSFANWGQGVAGKDVRAGDVLMKNDRSHVGMAEGAARMGRNGLEVQMIAGNERDNRYAPGPGRSQAGMVGERWVPLSEFTARRAREITLPHRPVSQTPHLSTMSALHPVTTSSTSNSMHIDQIHVHSSASNASGIAGDIHDALSSHTWAGAMNYGQA